MRVGRRHPPAGRPSRACARLRPRSSCKYRPARVCPAARNPKPFPTTCAGQVRAEDAHATRAQCARKARRVQALVLPRLALRQGGPLPPREGLACVGLAMVGSPLTIHCTFQCVCVSAPEPEAEPASVDGNVSNRFIHRPQWAYGTWYKARNRGFPPSPINVYGDCAHLLYEQYFWIRRIGRR